eukprot:COSAG02_NODE_20217_length_842_cov_1.422611_1_plen_70_part_01
MYKERLKPKAEHILNQTQILTWAARRLAIVDTMIQLLEECFSPDLIRPPTVDLVSHLAILRCCLQTVDST